MSLARFPFRFHPAFRAAALPFGIRPDTAEVDVVDDELDARFGRWRLRTSLSNVKSATVTGSYSWPKVLGPPHVSLRDRGVTFASNPYQGVCIQFRQPVPAIEPLGVVRHPALTVTVSEPAALAELLDRSSHDTARTHTPSEPTAADLIEETVDELSSLTAAELRQRARERGMTGVSRRSKAELLELLGPGDDDELQDDALASSEPEGRGDAR